MPADALFPQKSRNLLPAEERSAKRIGLFLKPLNEEELRWVKVLLEINPYSPLGRQCLSLVRQQLSELASNQTSHGKLDSSTD